MIRIVKTEFYKLKRYHILWAGVALMLLSVLLTLFTSMANDGSVWDFAYLTEQVIKNNMSMIFPMCISLIAGYMISREQTDDTLKNILTVPISFKRLLTGKLIVCGVLSIIFGLICSLFTVIAEMIVGFPGFQISLALKATLQITAVNFFLYLAVLPIIIITCRKAGSFLIGVIIAFVYGYGGMFAAGNMTLANLYPITAITSFGIDISPSYFCKRQCTTFIYKIQSLCLISNLPVSTPASWLLMHLPHRQRLPCSILHRSPRWLFRHK